MSRRPGAGLVPLSTLVVGVTLFVIAFAACALAFGSFATGLHRDAETLLDQATTVVARDDATHGAIAAARLAGQRLFRRSLVMEFVDDAHRVTVAYAPDAREPHVTIRDRGDRSGEPAAHGWFARVALGSAAIAGLTPSRGRVGGLDVYVEPNDAIFVAEIARAVPAVATVFAVLAVLAIVTGSVLNRQALRPLVEVTLALERLAAGDLQSQTVFASDRGELGRLATAYNGATARVASALVERDQANGAILQFIADAGHQLRTPLTVLRGFIAILEESAAERSAERDHILAVMRQQSAVIGQLVENLILLERWEHPQRAPATAAVDVRQLVEDIVGVLAEVHPLRRLSSVSDGSRELLATVDPHELGYAISNLVDNALKYTAGAIDVTIAATGRGVTIVVADDGPGMPGALVEHAFDRFSRGGRRDVVGSGLGLTIAKRAVERAGGTIALASGTDRGTTVRIELPGGTR